MNTTLKGDEFENRSFDAMRIAIEQGLLGLIPENVKIFQKKGYYSRLREKEIIFDISIEIWPVNAERATLIYLVECKDYTKKIPVDDIEEFNTKISQIADGAFFIKGVFITGSSFQKGALDLGKNLRFMMIELQNDNNLSIIYHKKKRDVAQVDIPHSEMDERMALFFQKVFDLQQRANISNLSKKNITKIAESILNDFDSQILGLGKKMSIEAFIKYVERVYGISIDLVADFDGISGAEVLGHFNTATNQIQINHKLQLTARQSFVFAHELGHFILHKNTGASQEYYDSLSDSEYDFRSGKHTLNNFRHWVEWQANYFAASLLMPQRSFKYNLAKYQISQGISKYGHIYLDYQRVNRRDYANILTYLSQYFNVSKTSVIYRLEEFNLITYATSSHLFNQKLREFSLTLDESYNNLQAFKDADDGDLAF